MTTQDESPTAKKTTLVLWGVIAGLAVLTFIFLVLFAVTASSKSTLHAQLSQAEAENDALEESVDKAQNELNEATNHITQLNDTIKFLRANVSTWTNTLSELIRLSNSQKEDINSYQRGNTFLWIGGGSGLALGAGSAGLGIYERIRYNDLAANLTLTTERYNHFRYYFELSSLWLMEDYVLYYYSTFCLWTTLYDSDAGWSRTAIVDNLKGANHTATLIMTDTDHLIAAMLAPAWTSDGRFIEDSRAFTMAVNVVWECMISKSIPDAVKHAARLNGSDSIVEFGNREIAVFDNRTGYALADVTFECSAYENDKFYAPTPRFGIKWLRVYHFSFAPTASVFQDQFHSLLRRYRP